MEMLLGIYGVSATLALWAFIRDTLSQGYLTVANLLVGVVVTLCPLLNTAMAADFVTDWLSEPKFFDVFHFRLWSRK